MNDSGLIKLNGRYFRILPGTYRVRDLADFAPRANLPAQSIVQSELLLYQPIVQEDWRHGMGFMWLTDSMGYQYSEGGIDTRYGGIICLSPKAQPISVTPIKKYIGTLVVQPDVNTIHVLFYGVGGIYNYISTEQLFISETAGRSVLSMLATSKYLFYSQNGYRLRKYRFSDGNVSDAGVNSNSKDYHWMVVHNGFVYAGKFQTNQVYYASNDDLSDLHGSPNDDPNVIYVGYKDIPTFGAISFGSDLYVAKPDGLWVIGQDNTARRVLNLESSSTTWDRVFNLFTIYNGYLYFNQGARIYQWNGARMLDVSIPRFTDAFPYVEVSQILAGTSGAGYLFVLASWKPQGSTKYIISLFAHDGVGWHKLYDFPYLYDNDAEMNWIYNRSYMMSFIPKVGFQWTQNSLVVGIRDKVYLDSMSYYKFYIGEGNSPTPPFNSSGTFYTSRIDAGFRRVTKSSPSILIQADNVINGTIHVEVKWDDQIGWTRIGTITSGGMHEFNFAPVNIYTKTIEYKHATFRFIISTNNENNTPIIENFTLRVLMRPDTFYGFNFDIVASKGFSYDGVVFEDQPEEIMNYIKQLRDSKAPIQFVDPFGSTYYGYISSVNATTLELFENDSEATNFETIINVNFVEAR